MFAVSFTVFAVSFTAFTVNFTAFTVSFIAFTVSFIAFTVSFSGSYGQKFRFNGQFFMVKTQEKWKAVFKPLSISYHNKAMLFSPYGTNCLIIFTQTISNDLEAF